MENVMLLAAGYWVYCFVSQISDSKMVISVTDILRQHLIEKGVSFQESKVEDLSEINLPLTMQDNLAIYDKIEVIKFSLIKEKIISLDPEFFTAFPLVYASLYGSWYSKVDSIEKLSELLAREDAFIQVGTTPNI